MFYNRTFGGLTHLKKVRFKNVKPDPDECGAMKKVYETAWLVYSFKKVAF